MRKWGCLFLMLVILVSDLWSKSLLSQALMLGQEVKLTSFLNFTLVHNHGAAFGFLANAGGWQRWFFLGIGLLITAVIMLLFYRANNRQEYYLIGLSSILAGAWGNLIDRIRLGYVVDFIDFHINDWHWPAFNVADIAITSGAIILLVLLFVKEKPQSSGNDC